eukprot:3698327-Amphidinium_carterae.1
MAIHSLDVGTVPDVDDVVWSTMRPGRHGSVGGGRKEWHANQLMAQADMMAHTCQQQVPATLRVVPDVELDVLDVDGVTAFERDGLQLVVDEVPDVELDDVELDVDEAVVEGDA